MNYVYILKCADDTFYIGWTNDLEQRVQTHNSGKGAKYTRARLPVELIYSETLPTPTEAQQREYRLKQLTRRQKLQLIAGENDFRTPIRRKKKRKRPSSAKTSKGVLPMKILVSACLLGVGCRYDGASKPDPRLHACLDRAEWIPVCPEILGGLPTPRIPAELREDGVFTQDGRDVTAQYQKGAEEVLRLAKLLGANAAVLKARSPSCGADGIYDGTFSKTLVDGQGVTARLLTEAGLPVYTEDTFRAALFPEETD